MHPVFRLIFPNRHVRPFFSAMLYGWLAYDLEELDLGRRPQAPLKFLIADLRQVKTNDHEAWQMYHFSQFQPLKRGGCRPYLNLHP